MPYDPNNLFAKILRGETPCIKVWESDAALAFMDIMPQSDGHLLVLPKEAAAEIFDLSELALSACMGAVRMLAIAMRQALQPDGLLIAQFNGRAAGQTVAHLHFHLIPRWEGVPLRPHGSTPADPEVLQDLARRIAASLP